MNCPRHKRGFTLIELLVVIAIIAILASMLLPALNSARDKGRQAVCMSNLKQISQATAFYTDENESFFPQAGARPFSNLIYFCGYLVPYLRGDSCGASWVDNSPFVCPSTEYTDPLIGGAVGTWETIACVDSTIFVAISYGYNSNRNAMKSIGGRTDHGHPAVIITPSYKESRLTNPSKIVISTDCVDLNAGGPYFSYDTLPNDGALNKVDLRHSDGAVALFCDGHVEYRKSIAVDEMNPTL